MKLSLLITAVIVAAFATLGWQENQQLSSARQVHEQLVREAQSLGIDTGDLSGKNKTPVLNRIQRKSQEDHLAAAKVFAVKLIDFGVMMKEREMTREEPDEGMQQQIMGIMSELMALDSEQLKTLIAELRATNRLDDDMRTGIVGFSIMLMGQDHPEAALTLYAETKDLKGHGMMTQGVAASLSRWAEKDPVAAMDWIHKNAAGHPELITDETKAAVLTGAAKQDPKLAFSLIKDLGLKDGASAGSGIAEGAKTPEERSAMLAAMHDYIATVTDPAIREQIQQGTMAGLSRTLMSNGFDASSKWLESASLKPEEIQSFVSQLSPWWTKDDSGKWIDWMTDKVPADVAAPKVQEIVGQWTQQDYKAAGTWLGTAKDGPAKQAAVSAYVNAVAPYEPAVAAQWVDTLPASDSRNKLIETVMAQWKQKDSAAAESYAKSHGIKK